MLRRRNWITGAAAILAGTGIGNFLAPRISQAQDSGTAPPGSAADGAKQPRLEDQLRYGLRCATPHQMEYVKLVADAVEQGQIPREMVNLVYRWSLERNPRVPFPYFQFVLRELGKRRNLPVP
jgi:hypothetical protein